MANNSHFNKHIAVLAFPFATHAPPLFSLTLKLSTTSSDARFSFFSTAHSNNTLFKNHHNLNAVRPYNIADGSPENYVFSGKPKEPVDNFLKATPENFKTAMETAVSETGMAFSCIITDAFFWFAADMARELQVPWVAFWTAGPRSLLIHVETDVIREKLGFNEGSIQVERTLDFIPGFAALPASYLPAKVTSNDLNDPFASMLHKMGQMLPRATSVIINSFEQIDPIPVNQLNSKLQNFLNIGPLVLTLTDQESSDPHGCIDWLDQQKQGSVVYISFGSVVMPPPDELSALAEALEAGGFSFIWSFRGSSEDKLPQGFLDRTKDKGIMVPWAPQLHILQHSSTGAFMTHCGWNSVLESIVGGVPLICRPFFGDQRMNAWTVEAEWRVGVEIKGGKITKECAMQAIEVVLFSEEGKQMKHKLDGLKKLAFDAADSHGTSIKSFETLVEIAI